MNPFSPIATSRRPRSLLATLASVVLALSAPLTTVQAASPSSGTVSETGSPTWDGAIGKAPTASATCAGPNDPACDNYRLTIDPGSLTSYIVTITLTPVGADDWDVQVYNPDGGVAGSSGNAPGTAEIVSLNNPPAGTYTVAASPYAAPLGYAAVATLDPTDPVVNNPGTEQVEFYSYADPGGHSFGEPSAGINWQSEPADGTLGGDNGGAIMYISYINTLRIGLNDCTAPATYLDGENWVERNAPLHLDSLDPIIFTDHITGRTQSSQLAGKTSLLMWTDVDGGTAPNQGPPVWNPSQGAGINSGVDHQTIGGGRLAEPLFSELDGNNPAYNGFAHGVYYCSQDIAVAQCGLSLDGGTTFGPAVPMYNLTTCSGLHGHVEVSTVDGTAYVPNASCGGEQGVALTEDNNTTWRVRTVPNSGSSSSDPSAAVGSAGRLYFGYDNSGLAYTAVSDDKGDSWYNITNVGESFGIKSTAFPEMIAGDDDRAAFAFLGSTTPGAIGDDPDFPAAWHMYVAMTFDGGASWTTTKVDPNDPVQRGTICGGGFGGCDNGTRNLLDFNDIQIDKRGRPVVVYADGCIDDCVGNPDVNTLSNLSTIARLKSPKGLFAAFDAERSGQPDWPLASASANGADVTVNWFEPGDGGNPITGYTVTGPGGLNVSLPPEARSYTDTASADVNGAYQVFAANAAGTSRTKPMCNYNVVPADVTPEPQEDPCDFLGVTILTDPAGDSDFDLTPAEGLAAYDLTRLGISETDEMGAGKISFLLHVQSTEILPPDSYWPVLFKDPAGNDRFVRMSTDALGNPSFEYGSGDIVTAAGTPADPQSGLVGTGVIRIVVNRADIGAGIGDTLTEFLVRVRASGGVLTPDNMPGSLARIGNYTLMGSENCVVVENQPPVAANDSATTTVDTPVTIDALANDSDPDGDSLSITGTGKADHGRVLVIRDAGGDKIRYEPNQGYVGPDAFTYSISDGRGGSAQATVTVDVQGVQGNNPPTARDDKAKTRRDTPIVIQVLTNDSDPDGDSLSITQVTQPQNGSAVNNGDQTITYDPDTGFKGKDSFTYTVSDGRGGSDSATVSVKVNGKDKHDFDEDGKDDDEDSDDDNDGQHDDADADDDNDGINDDDDDDDDNDGIEDDYDDQSTDDEVQGQSARAKSGGSNRFGVTVDTDTLVLIAAVRGPAASMLTVNIIDSSGLPLATSVPTTDGVIAIASPLLIGDFTIEVKNPTLMDIDYELTTVRQQLRP